jgi:hypothetical protein
MVTRKNSFHPNFSPSQLDLVQKRLVRCQISTVIGPPDNRYLLLSPLDEVDPQQREKPSHVDAAAFKTALL